MGCKGNSYSYHRQHQNAIGFSLKLQSLDLNWVDIFSEGTSFQTWWESSWSSSVIFKPRKLETLWLLSLWYIFWVYVICFKFLIPGPSAQCSGKPLFFPVPVLTNFWPPRIFFVKTQQIRNKPSNFTIFFNFLL